MCEYISLRDYRACGKRLEAANAPCLVGECARRCSLANVQWWMFHWQTFACEHLQHCMAALMRVQIRNRLSGERHTGKLCARGSNKESEEFNRKNPTEDHLSRNTQTLCENKQAHTIEKESRIESLEKESLYRCNKGGPTRNGEHTREDRARR